MTRLKPSRYVETEIFALKNHKPTILIIDSHTGYKIHHIEGGIDAQIMIDIMSLYTKKGLVDGNEKHYEDRDGHVAPSSQDYVVPEQQIYPTLPPEPAVGTTGIVKIAIRLPHWARIPRKFLATNPIQVLWSFATSRVP